MQFLTRFSLKNPVAILILCFLLIGGGIYSFLSLKTELLPDIELQELAVTVVYPGASSSDVNQQVTERLEGLFKGLTNLDSMRSQSMESLARISLSFSLGADMDVVFDETERFINEANLPDNVNVTVDRFSFDAFPIMNLALFSPNGEEIEDWTNEVLRPELSKIPGVRSVAISGFDEQFIRITVDNEMADQNGISLDTIRQAITNTFFSFPAGLINQQEMLVPVRVEQSIETLQALSDIQVRSPITQQLISISELASVEPVSERQEIARYNLNQSLSLLVNKQQNANTVEVAERIYDVLTQYDERIDFVIAFDSAQQVKSSIDELISKGLLGALFASIAVFIFLRNFRATIIAIISIPLSLLIGSIFMNWFDLTLNVMTLAGLAVAVGRVVDDSIIVIENVSRKIGLDPTGERNELTIAGTREMINPILSSTVASIVVFLPLGLVGGVTGAFFLPFALTIVFALLASTVVALTIIPILARFSFAKSKKPKKEPFFVRYYEKAIRWSLKRQLVVILLAVVTLFAVYPLAGSLGFVFLPNEQTKIISAEVELPYGTSFNETNRFSVEIEEALTEQSELYEKVFSSIGNFDFMSGMRLPNRAQYFIELAADANVDEALVQLEDLLESAVSAQYLSGVVNVSEFQTGGPPANNSINIDLFSDDLEELRVASIMVEQLMSNRADLKYVNNNFEEKQAQWTVKLIPEEVSRLGLSPFQVLGVIREQTSGVEAGSFTIDGIEQELRIVYEQPLVEMGELEALTFFSAQGPVQLSQFASVEEGEVEFRIQKLNERVYARVSAQIIGDNIRTVTNDVTAAIEALNLPPSVSLESGGGSDETIQTLIDILVAIVIAIGLVYLTLLVFFGKARIPFVILTSLLFVPIGSILALLLGREPLSMSAMIGVLMLVGIVVTNAIVLIDRTQQNRETGMTINDALIEAGKTRIRPILMTAFATVAALLPLAFSTPEGGLISRGLALVVVGGMTTSTILTLLFLPVIYQLSFYRQHRKERLSQG
jgi:HAE1 family hydrophobic/amphiphilic exporter-1